LSSSYTPALDAVAPKPDAKPLRAEHRTFLEASRQRDADALMNAHRDHANECMKRGFAADQETS